MDSKRERLFRVAAEVWVVMEGPGHGDIKGKDKLGRGNSCCKGPAAQISSLGWNPKKAPLRLESSAQAVLGFHEMRQEREKWANRVETWKAQLQVLKLDFIPLNMKRQNGPTCHG